MSKQKKGALCVEANGNCRFISVPASRALELHHHLRSNHVRCAPPEPAYTGFDRIELAKEVNADQVQGLLNEWR